MDLKILSTIAVGVTLAAIDTGTAEAKPIPADQFHWSTAIQANRTTAGRTVQYNRKVYVRIPLNPFCTRSGRDA